MEQRLLSQIAINSDRNTLISSDSTDAALSLINNPATSSPTLSSLLDILILHLQNPKSDHQIVLSLLSSLYTYHPNLRRRVSAAALDSIHLPWLPIPLIPNILSLIDPAESSKFNPFADESLFLSLCFCPSVKTRRWALTNITKFHMRQSVFLIVALGFTKDPYPYIRKAALDALVILSKEVVVNDRSLIQGGYFRAVELLFDSDNSVRCSSVHAVGELGRLILTLNPEETKREWSDALFVQLCLMVRDMEMEIRVAAFCELEKIQIVSNDILLQTLSKKCLPAIKDIAFHGQYTAKILKLPATTAAYTLVHGLEDEFYEVRKSACHAMQMLSILSVEFTTRAMDILIDMLNDDSVTVRLQCLETLHCMYSNHRFKIEETHLDMLCVTLIDSNSLIRSAVRDVLRLSNLRNLEMFKTCFKSFIENLELYPKDEGEVFNVLYKIGRSHGRFVTSIIRKYSDELEPCFDGKLGFNKLRTVALLVLAISAPVSFERKLSSVPPQVFSYAVTLLDRISNALHDLADETSILIYLSHCSKFTLASPSENFDVEVSSFRHEDSILKSHDIGEPEKANSTEFILHKLIFCWPFLQHGLVDEVFRTLRSFKEELRNSSHNQQGQSAKVIFTLNLLRVIKSLARAFRSHFSPKIPNFKPSEILNALSKTETGLEEIANRFIELRSIENLHLLELMLVTYVLRFSYTQNSSYIKTLKSLLQDTENFNEEVSRFIIELRRIFLDDIFVEKLKELRDSVTLFTLKPFNLTEELGYLNADIQVRDNDFHRPFRFVPGLPIGIPLDISLYNAVPGIRLWIVASIGMRRVEFISVDLDDFNGCREARKCRFVVPFYGTPDVKRFSVNVCVGREGLREDLEMKNCGFGPKGRLVYICKEKVVYLSREIC